MNVTHKGRRYWAHGPLIRDLPDGRRFIWNFWSDHKPVLYHGSVTLLENDLERAEWAFRRWLPFKT